MLDMNLMFVGALLYIKISLVTLIKEYSLNKYDIRGAW